MLPSPAATSGVHSQLDSFDEGLPDEKMPVRIDMGAVAMEQDAHWHRQAMRHLIAKLSDKIERVPLPEEQEKLEHARYDALAEVELRRLVDDPTPDIRGTLRLLRKVFQEDYALEQVFRNSRAKQNTEYKNRLFQLGKEFFDNLKFLQGRVEQDQRKVCSAAVEGITSQGTMTDKPHENKLQHNVIQIEPTVPASCQISPRLDAASSFTATSETGRTETTPLVQSAAKPSNLMVHTPEKTKRPQDRLREGNSTRKRRLSDTPPGISKRQCKGRFVNFADIPQDMSTGMAPRILPKQVSHTTTYYILQCKEHRDVTFSHMDPIREGINHLRLCHSLAISTNRNTAQKHVYEILGVQVLHCNYALMKQHNDRLNDALEQDVLENKDRPGPNTLSFKENMIFETRGDSAGSNQHSVESPTRVRSDIETSSLVECAQTALNVIFNNKRNSPERYNAVKGNVYEEEDLSRESPQLGKSKAKGNTKAPRAMGISREVGPWHLMRVARMDEHKLRCGEQPMDIQQSIEKDNATLDHAHHVGPGATQFYLPKPAEKIEGCSAAQVKDAEAAPRAQLTQRSPTRPTRYYSHGLPINDANRHAPSHLPLPPLRLDGQRVLKRLDPVMHGALPLNATAPTAPMGPQ